MTLTITHKYLRDILNSFSEENFSDLFVELQYSTLIVPVNEGIVPSIKIKRNSYIPLFTDFHEFNKFNSDGFEAVVNEFNDYFYMLMDNGFDGFVINPEGERFILSREIFKGFDPSYIFHQDYEPFTTNEIRRVKNSIKNDELNEFIRDKSVSWDLDRLIQLLNKSTLLTLLVSDTDFINVAENTVLSTAETGFLPKCLYEVGGKHYLLLFSSDLSEDPLPNSPEFKYAQIVNFPLLVEEVLNHDFDGFILNVDTDNITVPRESLRHFIKDFRSPNLDDYSMYSFTI